MAYNYNIPQSNDSLSVSQPQILGNFQALGVIGGNGQAASASLNLTSGFNFVYLSPQVPTPAIPAGNVGLYSATNAATGVNELYVNKTITGPTVKQIPMTAYVLGGTNAGNGWTYLPSGLLMAWGRSTTGGSTSVTLTYNTELTNFPGFNTANAFPQLTRITGAGATENFVALTGYNQTTFTVSSSLATTGTGIQFCWFVIGI